MEQLQNFQNVSDGQLSLSDKIKNYTQERKMNYGFTTFDLFGYIINTLNESSTFCPKTFCPKIDCPFSLLYEK